LHGERRNHSKRQVAVRDRAAERAFPLGAFYVDMDPLMIAGAGCKGVNPLLVDCHPIGNTKLSPDPFAQAGKCKFTHAPLPAFLFVKNAVEQLHAAVFFTQFLLLGLDPLPQLFMGDSGSYLFTAVSGWIPPDRSFLYGYVIRWSSLGTGSLTSLLILQAFLAAMTAILVALICRCILGLTSGLSYLFGVLCSLDPLQLVWERYVMTETVSLFFYVFALFFSFLYLKQHRLCQLAIVQILSVFLISFRMSYLLVVQISAFLLPLIAFLPEIRAAFWKHSSTLFQKSGLKSLGLHLAFSILLMFVLQQGYRLLNGRLAGREPALLHNSGLAILTTWAPALKPSDSPDPRLAELIAEGDQFRLNNIWWRDVQLYSPEGLVGRWKQIEPNPWTLLEEQYPIGSVIRGQVRNVTDFGIFVGVQEGIDGLVHVSDISWTQRIKHPGDLFKKGDEVEAVVLNIEFDGEKPKVSLGIKQLVPDPWDRIPYDYPVGKIVECKVLKVLDFGAFVEIERGVEGLIHVSEFSEERVEDPKQFVKVGQTLKAEIIGVDTAERKIGLSFRGATRAEELADAQGFSGGVPTATLGDVMRDKLAALTPKKNDKDKATKTDASE